MSSAASFDRDGVTFVSSPVMRVCAQVNALPSQQEGEGAIISALTRVFFPAGSVELLRRSGEEFAEWEKRFCCMDDWRFVDPLE